MTEKEVKSSEYRPLILYDGPCHLCNAFVRFVLKRDRQGVFYFAPLQTSLAQRLDIGSGQTTETVVLLQQDGKLLTQSDAVLAIFGQLQSPWNWMRLFRYLPGRLRDGLYRLVARYRNRFFGREEACILPDARYRERFVDFPNEKSIVRPD
jgi:predicted DCC family thiol-disulfide oxidoreductase YuxK